MKRAPFEPKQITEPIARDYDSRDPNKLELAGQWLQWAWENTLYNLQTWLREKLARALDASPDSTAEAAYRISTNGRVEYYKGIRRGCEMSIEPFDLYEAAQSRGTHPQMTRSYAAATISSAWLGAARKRQLESESLEMLRYLSVELKPMGSEYNVWAVRQADLTAYYVTIGGELVFRAIERDVVMPPRDVYCTECKACGHRIGGDARHLIKGPSRLLTREQAGD